MFQTDEKYEINLKSLQLELMNLGEIKDKLERQLLYDKLSPGAEKLINIRLVQIRKCYIAKLYQLRDHKDGKTTD